VTGRIFNVMRSLALVLALVSLARPAAAQETAESLTGLRSPEQRNVRYSAYGLPTGMWSFDVSALGVNGEDLYGSLSIKRGFGLGFTLELNLAHYAVGLFNIGAQWSFLDTKYFALAASVGFTYGHGAWIWLVAPGVKDLLEEADLFTVPTAITASSPVLDWLQLDLSVNLRLGTIFGTLGDGANFYADAEIGATQVAFRPGVRAFVSEATALEVAFDVPVYTWVPWEGTINAELRDKGYSKSGSGGATLPTSETWKLEAGVRSALTPWLICTFRIHYGRINRLLYRTTINPSLSLEFRL
jgi:hypothetical protein